MNRAKDDITSRPRRALRSGDFICERILRSLSAGASIWPATSSFEMPLLETTPALRVLLVVAHPDDESECAAVVYRVTHELGGVVDQVIVTNGEGGFEFAAPAQAFYRLPLAHKEAGRKHLCKIRRQEVLRASRILRIRDHYFFNQRDSGFTLDPYEGLRAWNVPYVRKSILALLQREDYDLVLTLLPGADLHGHHQSVAVLTLEAVAELAPEKRPAVMAVRSAGEAPEPFSGLPEFPLTCTSKSEPIWSFDRRTSLGTHPALDYSIIVHWVIAEHKSQGMFQMEYGRKTHECYWRGNWRGPLAQSSGCPSRTRRAPFKTRICFNGRKTPAC